MAKHVVVTGTSTGLGRAIALEARRQGWNVLGTVRREADRPPLESAGVHVGVCDITDAEDVAALARLVAEWSDGRLDALVNNAGTSYPCPVEVQDLDDIRAQFEVNVISQIAITQALLDLIRAAAGRIVMVSSDSVSVPPPALGAYAASKRALEAMAASMDLEVRPSGATVHIVRPGPFETAIWDTSTRHAERYETDGSPYAALAKQVREFALDPSRMGDPDDLAKVVVALLGRRRPRFVTTFPRTVQGTVVPLLPWWLYRFAVARTLAGTAGRTRRGRRARR